MSASVAAPAVRGGWAWVTASVSVRIVEDGGVAYEGQPIVQIMDGSAELVQVEAAAVPALIAALQAVTS